MPVIMMIQSSLVPAAAGRGCAAETRTRPGPGVIAASLPCSEGPRGTVHAAARHRSRWRTSADLIVFTSVDSSASSAGGSERTRRERDSAEGGRDSGTGTASDLGLPPGPGNASCRITVLAYFLN